MDFTMGVSAMIFFFLTNLGRVFSSQNTSDRDVLCNAAERQFIQEVASKYGWRCIASGGSAPKQIEYIYLEFSVDHRATIDEARTLNVLLVERFREIINANTRLKPHLCESPFPSSRLHIGLSFYSSLGVPSADGTLVHVSQVNNKLFFKTLDPWTGHFVPLRQEPYPEAKETVELSSLKDPLVHEEKPHEPIIDAIFEDYLKAMRKQYHLSCERIGGKLAESVEEVVARLVYFRPTGIDKARELQVIATEKLCEMINGNEQLRPYLKEYPLPLEKIRVAVLFRKSNNYPYYRESLEGAYRQGDEVIYLIEAEDDPHGTIKKPEVFARESYPEAREKVKNSANAKKLKIKW